MTKTIIVDIEGVIVNAVGTKVTEMISKDIGSTSEQLNTELQQYMHDLRCGTLTMEEVYAEILHKLGIEKDLKELLKLHLEYYEEVTRPINQAMVDLVNELKLQYQVFGLTNNFKEVAEWSKTAGYYDMFEKMYISCELGKSKTQPELYKDVLEMNGLQSEDVIFIDDKESYLEAARTLGITCVLFDNVEQCRKDLKLILE